MTQEGEGAVLTLLKCTCVYLPSYWTLSGAFCNAFSGENDVFSYSNIIWFALVKTTYPPKVMQILLVTVNDLKYFARNET